MRCFLAVIPPADVIAGIERFLEPRRTASQRSPWRWTRPGSYHVTLAFMADYPDQRTEELIQGLDAWAQRRAPLTMTVAGAGAFRSPERAKVLYLGVPGEAAARLGEWSQQLRALVTHHGGRPCPAGRPPRPGPRHLRLSGVHRLRGGPRGVALGGASSRGAVLRIAVRGLRAWDSGSSAPVVSRDTPIMYTCTCTNVHYSCDETSEGSRGAQEQDSAGRRGADQGNRGRRRHPPEGGGTRPGSAGLHHALLQVPDRHAGGGAGWLGVRA